MTKENEKKLTTGEVSKAYDISVKTLRYYDEIGLLKPKDRGSQSRYRYYDNEEIGTLMAIKYYQSAGVPLKKIRAFLDATSLTEINALFLENLAEQEAEIDAKIIARDNLAAWQRLVAEGEFYLSQKEIPFTTKKLRLLHTLAEGAPVAPAKEKHYGSLRQRSLATGQQAFGAVYYEYASWEKIIAGEAQLCVNHMEINPRTFRGIDYAELGGCNVAAAIHIGPHAAIVATYRELTRWCERNRLTLRGDAIERNIIDNATFPEEQRYVTEVMLPLR